MRHLTDIDSKAKAEAFVAYLLTKGISTHVEPENVSAEASTYGAERWSVWIRDEDRIGEAKTELQHFLSNPSDERYRSAIQEARAIVVKQREEQKQREKNIHKVRTSSSIAGAYGGKLPPLTLLLIIVCVVTGLITQFSRPDKGNDIGIFAVRELTFVDMEKYRETSDPAYSLKKLELWRIITPAFLHGGAIHLLLNMFSLASLGRIAERMEGLGRYALILLICGIGAHLLQGLMPLKFWGGPNFVGISGVVLGLFGYMAVKSKLKPNLGFFFPPSAYLMVAVLVGFGFMSQSGLGLANMAHLGGLLTGALLGVVMNK